jgi:hypothetical protein
MSAHYVRFEPMNAPKNGNRSPAVIGPFESRTKARRERARLIRAERFIEPRLSVDVMGWGIHVWSDVHNGCPETFGEGRYIVTEGA